MLKCEKCNKYYNITDIWKSTRFCSSFCAHSYISSFINHKCKKEGVCKRCGKKIFISKHASYNNSLCEECKKTRRRKQMGFADIHRKQIKTLIKYFGFDESKNNNDNAKLEYNRIRNELYDLYWNKHKSSTEIAKIYNYPNAGNLTNKVFKYLDIPSKSCYEASHENVLYNRINYLEISSNIYKHGWYNTWNNKKVYLRSSYEFDYAKYLDEHKINYEVEYFRIEYFDTQKNKLRIAIPDFYLVETNTLVEIKSNFTFDEQNMKDKFCAYKKLGYETKLILEHKNIDDF